MSLAFRFKFAELHLLDDEESNDEGMQETPTAVFLFCKKKQQQKRITMIVMQIEETLKCLLRISFSFIRGHVWDQKKFWKLVKILATLFVILQWTNLKLLPLKIYSLIQYKANSKPQPTDKLLNPFSCYVTVGNLACQKYVINLYSVLLQVLIVDTRVFMPQMMMNLSNQRQR